MVKMRVAPYCNLKLFLIYLVVYGHWIEAGIRETPALLIQYRLIYLFHMPLFAFLSGLFLRNGRDCAGQLKRMLPLYLFLQTAAVFLGHGEVRPLTPFWHLWYLLSLSTWAALGWLWFRLNRGKWLVLAAAVLLGCFAGYIPSINRTLSLSRSIVFFPYFFAGLLCRPGYDWKRLRLPGLAALVPAVIGIGLLWEKLPTAFLYHAAPFGSVKNGFALRLSCYGIGACLCLFLLAFAPQRRFPFTKAGADTMGAYLIHAPLVLVLRELQLPWLLYPLLSAGLLYMIYKIRQWRGGLYGIVPGERRDGEWPRLRKSMSNTPDRSTGSCCP